ncbi:MAG: RNA methyltransferase [Candidatus Pacebacteria bacterium]|nr:RNA methyltransferase [Candidatus Paceibacterota bacterium]
MNSKSIKKLQEKKYRTESGLFLVEGEKSVLELLASDFIIRELYVTRDFTQKHSRAIAAGTFERKGTKCITVDKTELASFGTLQSNNAALAIVLQKKESKDIPTLLPTDSSTECVLALDGVTDPGNLGTIIRIADWFGITTIVASRGSVDFYNPKSIAASMGSFAHIHFSELDLPAFLSQAQKNSIPIIGATLKGKNVHEAVFPHRAIIVMGSESHGISTENEKLLTEKVMIPRYGKAESLNVAAATAIMLDSIRRKDR